MPEQFGGAPIQPARLEPVGERTGKIVAGGAHRGKIAIFPVQPRRGGERHAAGRREAGGEHRLHLDQQRRQFRTQAGVADEGRARPERPHHVTLLTSAAVTEAQHPPLAFVTAPDKGQVVDPGQHRRRRPGMGQRHLERRNLGIDPLLRQAFAGGARKA